MTTDHSAATREQDDVATTAVWGRQASLAEVGADAEGHQTTLGTHGGADAGEVPDETPDPADLESVNAFPMRDVLLVKHYFEDPGAFEVLKPYYDQRHYRFAVPQRELGTVQDALGEHGYELTVVDYLEPFAVVVRKYSHHPESVFEDSVAEFSNDDFNVFVMKDEAAVEAAATSGARRLAAAPLEVRFPTAQGTGPLTVEDVATDRR